jgi:hypothetical protein
MRLRTMVRSAALGGAIDAIVDQVRSGAESRRPRLRNAGSVHRPKSMPSIPLASTATEHCLLDSAMLATSLKEARNLSLTPADRIAEACTALQSASNLYDRSGLQRGHQAVNAVRHSPDVNPFDVCRADVIYFASKGDRPNAIAAAEKLRDASRNVPDIQLACRGLRNAAEVFFMYGETATSQSLLHEARLLAVELQYFSQIAKSDIRLAELYMYEMDTDGANAHLESATEIILKNRIATPLISADLHLFDCWTAICNEEFSRAQRAARVVVRRLANQKTGIGYFTRLSVRLATRGGRFTDDVQKSVQMLKSSVNANAFSPNEQLNLAALLITTQRTHLEAETREFVASQLPRISSTGSAIWPLIRRYLT